MTVVAGRRKASFQQEKSDTKTGLEARLLSRASTPGLTFYGADLHVLKAKLVVTYQERQL